jgi:hypothetical protein
LLRVSRFIAAARDKFLQAAEERGEARTPTKGHNIKPTRMLFRLGR